jgi:hypothetical protein
MVAVLVLFLQNQDLRDRVETLENAARQADVTQEAPSPNGVPKRVDALSTCLAQLHAQVVSLWNDDLLPPDGMYCKKRFYGVGPRVGD